MLIAGFGASIITARLLGPAGRGDFFFMTTLAATVVQVANLGLQSSNTYLVAQDRSLLRRLLANSLWISVALGIVVAGVVTLALRYGRLIPNAPSAYLWYVILLTPPLLFFMLGANLLVGIGRIGTFNVIEAGARLGVVLAFGVVALAGASVGRFLTANVLAWTAACAWLFGALALRGRGSWRFDRDVFWHGFLYATKAYATTLISFLVLRSNVFLLERMTTTSNVGYFSIATQISDALAIVPTSVALVLFPNLVRQEKDRFRLTLHSCVLAAVALTVICTIVAVAAGPVVRIVFGAGFEPSVRVLRWMLPGVVALGATSIVSQYLAAIGFPRALLGAWGGGLALVLVLGYFLIRSHGASGAAVALSFTYGVLFVAILGIAWHYDRREPLATIGDAFPLDLEGDIPS
jgi:O-antigen/teichoic acid export membrane protein